uniref:Glutathione-regulated potassium-efflux system ancillary protein kefG n=1 Tax=Yersinia enterocolitica W22703 TaxID=913028 RepID=F4N1T2_YEREN|nr:glutathione-regulated potassium-efflux system ancillary protein kefG [Yersinia enterocolitica W22703]
MLQPVQQLEHVTVHDLYAHYPDFFIDIHYEQQLLREHQIIVFQHPLYTYSCPALLKNGWIACWRVALPMGWGGDALTGKYWRSVITTGEPEGAYRRGGITAIQWKIFCDLSN